MYHTLQVGDLVQLPGSPVIWIVSILPRVPGQSIWLRGTGNDTAMSRSIQDTDRFALLQSTNAIENAAAELIRFMFSNIAPEAAWESGQEEDWPIAISGEQAESIMLSEKLQVLGDLLSARGFRVIDPE